MPFLEKYGLDELCVNAIRSLPSFVERSDLMLILAPVVKHRHRADGYVCNYISWRTRGWCRLELASALLARTSPRIMVVRGLGTPYFATSSEANQLPVGAGQFTCCARNHDFGHGIVPCDKTKIGPVLDTLLNAKVGQLQSMGREHLIELRNFQVMRKFIFSGLPYNPTPRAIVSGGSALSRVRA